MLVRLLVQRFAQVRDVRRQVPFLNNRVRPDLPHQLVFIEHLAAVLDQRQKCVELLREQFDGRALAEQEAFLRVEAEVAKLVNVLVLLTHRRFHKFQEIPRGISRTSHVLFQ